MQAPLIPKNEIERLATLRALDVLDTPSEDRFDRITRVAQALFDVPIALLTLVDAQRQWFKSRQGLTVCETSRDVSFCGHAILEDKVLWVVDAGEDPRFQDNPLVTGAPGIRFYAGYPIRTTGGQCLGTLCIIDSKPRPFSPVEQMLLADLGRMAGRELESLHAGTPHREFSDKSPEQRRLLIDGVTGVWNREGMLQILRESLGTCVEKKQTATVLLVELDISSKMSERWSARGQDMVVAEIAQVLRSCIPGYDSIGRTRNEQFTVLLRGLPVQTAGERVAEIRRKLDDNPILHSIGVPLHLGHSCVVPDSAAIDVEAELEAARKSLARARRVTEASRV